MPAEISYGNRRALPGQGGDGKNSRLRAYDFEQNGANSRKG